MVSVKKDLTDMVFGRLRVLKQTEDYVRPNGEHMAKWLCECSCEKHTQVEVLGQSLKGGKTKSCGCLTMDRLPKLFFENKKENIYSEKQSDEYGEYYIIYSNPDQKEFGYIDADRISEVKKYSWCVSHGYFVSCINGVNIKMHQYLFGKWMDHKDCNKLNNRLYNIRKCDNSKNIMNARNKKVGKSGYRGVHITKSGKYKAQIAFTTDGIQKTIYGKPRDTAEDAYIDYLNLAAKYHGEFSSVLDDIERYGILLSDGMCK